MCVFQVHSFGSVPLKTYLPDGDIDLTAFGGLYHEEELAAKVFSVLEREEHNVSSHFVVKDVQLIRAEVCLHNLCAIQFQKLESAMSIPSMYMVFMYAYRVGCYLLEYLNFFSFAG